MNEQDTKLLEDEGWMVVCESPFELEMWENGECLGTATEEGAELVLKALRHEKYRY